MQPGGVLQAVVESGGGEGGGVEGGVVDFSGPPSEHSEERPTLTLTLPLPLPRPITLTLILRQP